VNLNIDDLRDGNLFIRSEKNEKNRLVPLPDGLVNDLQKYIEHYRMQTDPRALFTSKKGRMDYNYIRKVIKNPVKNSDSQSYTLTLSDIITARHLSHMAWIFVWFKFLWGMHPFLQQKSIPMYPRKLLER